MMNGLQTLTFWQNYFKHPTDSQLGLLNAIMSIGGVVALPIFAYVADYLGRRLGIIIGCIICVGGVVLQTIGANIGMFIAAR
jgi:MFS family permease